MTLGLGLEVRVAADAQRAVSLQAVLLIPTESIDHGSDKPLSPFGLRSLQTTWNPDWSLI